MGLAVKIGIGPNPLLAKVCLDTSAKHHPEFIDEWHYNTVPNTLWQITNLTDMWGIGSKTATKLQQSFAIHSIKDLAFTDPYALKRHYGIIGFQLFAHAWGIDRSLLNQRPIVKDKSYGKSQILDKDYYNRHAVEIIISEMADQVAGALRDKDLQTSCISLSIGYSRGSAENNFTKQTTISPSHNSQLISHHLIDLFRNKDNPNQPIRSIAISFSKLISSPALQLNLFEDTTKQIQANDLDKTIDRIRQQYGYSSLIRATSLMEDATALKRDKLIGGH